MRQALPAQFEHFTVSSAKSVAPRPGFFIWKAMPRFPPGPRDVSDRLRNGPSREERRILQQTAWRLDQQTGDGDVTPHSQPSPVPLHPAGRSGTGAQVSGHETSIGQTREA